MSSDDRAIVVGAQRGGADFVGLGRGAAEERLLASCRRGVEIRILIGYVAAFENGLDALVNHGGGRVGGHRLQSLKQRGGERTVRLGGREGISFAV